MEASSAIRVKMKFREKVKITMLADDKVKILSSMSVFKNLVYERFPEIRVECEISADGSPSPSAARELVVRYEDQEGDCISLECEEDFQSIDIGNQKSFTFYLDVVTVQPSSAATGGGRAEATAVWTAGSDRNSFNKDTSTSAFGFRTRPALTGASYRAYSEMNQNEPGVGCSQGAPMGRPDRGDKEAARNIRSRFTSRPASTGETSSNNNHVRGEMNKIEREAGRQKICHRFQRGSCRLGATCGSSHGTEFGLQRGASSTASSGALTKVLDQEKWLSNQLHNLSASENIEQLSSDRGMVTLWQIVQERSLSTRKIELLVRLLVKDNFRRSMMRELTNRVYGVLLGSQFLAQIRGHITVQLRNSTSEQLMPYLLLMEELQLRTSDGWKEVPLDAINNLIPKLSAADPVTDELKKIASRLLDHRDRLQRQLAISPTDKSFLGTEFRKMSIVPEKQELLEQTQAPLPVNRVNNPYSTVTEYLETHFRLLREDCIEPLRKGIQAYREDKKSVNSHELRIYSAVKLIGIRCGDQGIEYVVSFEDKSKSKGLVANLKRLKFNALLCISCDEFQTFFFGTVAQNSGADDKAKGKISKPLLCIRPMGECGNVRPFEGSKTYVMVESTVAYFEAYYHVLKSLKREDMENIPFTRYLLHLEHQVSPPSYLLRRTRKDEFDFAFAFPDMERRLGRSSLRITQEWPHFENLDEAQQMALKHGLTKELAIIQGPPGTGKTFLGLLLVKLILSNLKRSSSKESDKFRNHRLDEAENDGGGPILIVCYTNHALDQFLEGIYHFEKNLVRIGGRGKRGALAGRNLKSLLQEQRNSRVVNGSQYRAKRNAWQEKSDLEEEIQAFVESMCLKINVDRQKLRNIATQEQIDSLFLSMSSRFPSKMVVQMWLDGEDRMVVYRSLLSEWEADSSEASPDGPGPGALQKKDRGKMMMLPASLNQEDEERVEVLGAPGLRRLLREIEGMDIGEGGHEEELEWYTADEREEEMVELRHEEPIVEHEGALEFLPVRMAGMELGGQHPQMPGDVRPAAEEPRLERIIDRPNVWHLNVQERTALHRHWLDAYMQAQRLKLEEMSQKFEDVCKVVTQAEHEIQLSLLRKSKVVGMTTTAAARSHDLLKALSSDIVIVEEAAEVLEGHILACLSSSVKHLILIGDHLQLRPSVAVHQLVVKHKLDVSMFERLVRTGVEHVTLQEQRRMRPCFSKLMKSLYPQLRNHESVSRFEDVKGVTTNSFFFDHKAEEKQNSGDSSKVNPAEARLVVQLCLYLLNQDTYSARTITILTMYSGQIQEIRKVLRERIESRVSREALERKKKSSIQAVNHIQSAADGTDDGDEEDSESLLPRVSSVDDFQGEESDIIILSLVRSNNIPTRHGDIGKIGFLNIPNRTCVALTRARKGLYIFGNAELLSKKNSLWKEVTSLMREDGNLGPELVLFCENHPNTRTRIAKETDFQAVKDGGCSKPCETQLECGHVCPRRCHPGPHDTVVCPKPCSRQYVDCNHQCQLRCHSASDCPPCETKVSKPLATCGHIKSMSCSKPVLEELCVMPCRKALKCGHPCGNLCGRPCTEDCPVMVRKRLRCGHSFDLPCHKKPESYSCPNPCGANLPGCSHRCQGTCGTCKQGTQHISCKKKCGRSLSCGHQCESGCSVTCPPCERKCQKRCLHSICPLPCGEICRPCLEPCAWECEHHRCTLYCHEICTRARCDLPCTKLLPCNHPCIGLCGEPCPTACRVCHPETLDVVTQMTLGESDETDRFVQLEDCRHIFEVSGLDTWMDDVQETSNQSSAIKLKQCPQCTRPIWRTHRYSKAVKSTQKQIQEVKNMVHGRKASSEGKFLLERGLFKAAIATFELALNRNPELMDAHFGMACAAIRLKDLDTAVSHLSYIVRRSSFAPELRHQLERAQAAPDDNAGNSTADADTAKRAIVQWASVLTTRKDFDNAISLCDALLRNDPTHADAARIRSSAEKKVQQLIVQAMAPDVGGQGHWYRCRNGHLYTIGECGGAMEISVCPDCKEQIGGTRHQLLAGNSHSNIDGSTRSSWLG